MTTWNPSDAGTGLTFTNGNLDVHGTSTSQIVRATTNSSQVAGRVYVEVTETAAGGGTFGFANTTQSLGSFVGSGLNSIGWTADGRVLINNVTQQTIATYTVGNVKCAAIDFPNTNIWFRVDGGNWNNNVANDPATNTGGISFSTLNAGPYYIAQGCDGATQQHTANFGGTAFAQTIPSGFSAWDAAPFVPNAHWLPGRTMIMMQAAQGQNQQALLGAVINTLFAQSIM